MAILERELDTFSQTLEAWRFLQEHKETVQASTTGQAVPSKAGGSEDRSPQDKPEPPESQERGACDHAGASQAPQDPLFLKADFQTYQAARDKGQEWSYALWLLCRALDKTGGGSVPLQDLEQAVKERGLFYSSPVKPLGSLRRRIRQAIDGGWVEERLSLKDGKKLAYKGEARVCAMLETGRLRELAVYVPIEALRSLRRFRAQMLSVFYAQRGEWPLSRPALEEITGKTRGTLWTWEDLANVESVRQISVEPYKPGENVYNGQETTGGDTEDRGEYICRDTRTGQLLHVKPVPSVHLSPLKQAKRGRRRKVNRSISYLLGARENTARVTWEQRRYYEQDTAAMKAARKRTGVYLRTDQQYHGRGVWYKDKMIVT